MVLRKGFAAPSDGRIARLVIIAPWRTAVSITAWYVVEGEAWVLVRRVKPDVSNGNARSQGHGKRLDRAIEILVIERVFIVPCAIAQIGYFVTHEPDPIVARIGFELAHRCAGPGFNGRLLSEGGTGQRKGERGRSTGHSE